jgi:hypothetical protein
VYVLGKTNADSEKQSLYRLSSQSSQLKFIASISGYWFNGIAQGAYDPSTKVIWFEVISIILSI